MIAGIGINDYNSPIVRYEGTKQVWKCPIYTCWVNMLRRCYLASVHVKHPSYRGITVCKEWHSFSKFREWAIQSYKEGLELDKDLLVPHSNIYSPNTCMFVSKHINRFMSEHRTHNQPLPIGVTWDKKRNTYSVRGTDWKGKRIWLSYEKDKLLAHKIWQNHKLSVIRLLASTNIDPNLDFVLGRAILKLEHEIINNLETTALL